MPAVSLIKLKTQVELLLRAWEQPEELVRSLVDLLEYYSDRLYHAAEQTRSNPTLPAYRVPAVITHQVSLELCRAAAADPSRGLAAVEALWQLDALEPRQLAADMLGCLPPSMFPEVIQHLTGWITVDLPAEISTSLLSQATRQLRHHAPQEWLKIVRTWLMDAHPPRQILGLHALVPFIEDAEFENLPAIFSLVSPVIQAAPTPLTTDLLVVISALARRSPVETTYLVRRIAAASPQPNTLRLLRRALPAFPEQQQTSLRPVLRSPESKST